MMDRRRAVSIVLSALLAGIVFGLAGCTTLTGPKVEQPVDDAALVRTIRERIAADPDLSLLRVGVAVKRGDVTLSGPVPKRETKNRLIRLALGVHGVKSVKDNLTIQKR
jgi:osmotically-inducible protein OsmY